MAAAGSRWHDNGPVVEEPAVLGQVTAFHETFGVPVQRAGPRLPAPDRCNLRVALLQEELDELAAAAAASDLVACADALADLHYVLAGAVLEFGMQHCFRAVFDEVHRSNMSKACSTEEEAQATVEHYLASRGVQCVFRASAVTAGKFLVLRESDAKTLKSIRYSPPQLQPLLDMCSSSEPPQELRAFDCLAEFHHLFELPIETSPTVPARARHELLVRLLQEELDELKVAIGAQDLVECADALADFQYVLASVVLDFGLQHHFRGIFDEVHRSNMTKACATRQEAIATQAHYASQQRVESVVVERQHRSGGGNNAPIGGFVVHSAAGKVLKSVHFSPPRLQELLRERMALEPVAAAA